MLQNCHYMLIFWLLFFVSIHKKILALVLFSANLRKRVFFCFFVCFFFCFYGQESFGFSFNFKSSIFENIFWELFSFFSFFLSRSSSSVIHLSSKLQYFVEKKNDSWSILSMCFHLLVPSSSSSPFVGFTLCPYFSLWQKWQVSILLILVIELHLPTSMCSVITQLSFRT